MQIFNILPALLFIMYTKSVNDYVMLSSYYGLSAVTMMVSYDITMVNIYSLSGISDL